ncbi:MAG: hypothetical protein MHM6MM_006971, partial [Cercozoa sp. M6MM]
KQQHACDESHDKAVTWARQQLFHHSPPALLVGVLRRLTRQILFDCCDAHWRAVCDKVPLNKSLRIFAPTNLIEDATLLTQVKQLLCDSERSAALTVLCLTEAGGRVHLNNAYEVLRQEAAENLADPRALLQLAISLAALKKTAAALVALQRAASNAVDSGDAVTAVRAHTLISDMCLRQVCYFHEAQKFALRALHRCRAHQRVTVEGKRDSSVSPGLARVFAFSRPSVCGTGDVSSGSESTTQEERQIPVTKNAQLRVLHAAALTRYAMAQLLHAETSPGVSFAQRQETREEALRNFRAVLAADSTSRIAQVGETAALCALRRFSLARRTARKMLASGDDAHIPSWLLLTFALHGERGDAAHALRVLDQSLRLYVPSFFDTPTVSYVRPSYQIRDTWTARAGASLSASARALMSELRASLLVELEAYDDAIEELTRCALPVFEAADVRTVPFESPFALASSLLGKGGTLRFRHERVSESENSRDEKKMAVFGVGSTANVRALQEELQQNEIAAALDCNDDLAAQAFNDPNEARIRILLALARVYRRCACLQQATLRDGFEVTHLTGDFAEAAVGCVARATRLASSPLWLARSHLSRARLHFALGDRAAAGVALESAKAAAPSETRVFAAHFALLKGELAEAQAQAERHLMRDGACHAAWRILARTRLSLGDVAGAAEAQLAAADLQRHAADSLVVDADDESTAVSLGDLLLATRDMW